jgi:hypothetical protein
MVHKKIRKEINILEEYIITYGWAITMALIFALTIIEVLSYFKI